MSSYHVFVAIAPIGEAQWALLTLIRLMPRVKKLMIPSILFTTKYFVAILAFEHLLTRSVTFYNMELDPALSFVTLTAVVTEVLIL